MTAIEELAADLHHQMGIETACLNVVGELDIDIAIARRAGDQEAENKAATEKREAVQDWHRAYTDAKTTAAALCKAMDISESQLKRLL